MKKFAFNLNHNIKADFAMVWQINYRRFHKLSTLLDLY
ncbi:hypothetical protein VL20_1432 [Microcystis panniformis FACHB-1757]|uniref:Uncharacterized protein n=1 Tax=Microcystis panniformis FACHB-1757 TaxID=1638788 RepID=A0A0K1RY27_9CHRO|nr:hypothetical protein VL20_1432 [Microcystis panniformis FACHB-1757]